MEKVLFLPPHVSCTENSLSPSRSLKQYISKQTTGVEGSPVNTQ